jgi:hypothetical protein
MPSGVLISLLTIVGWAWECSAQLPLPPVQPWQYNTIHALQSSGAPTCAVLVGLQVFDVELRQVKTCSRRQMAMFSDVVCE